MSVDVIRDAEGRVRVGWKLLGFLGVFLALAVAGLWLVPLRGIAIQSAVMLGAALVAGWTLIVAVDGRSPAALGFYLDGDAVGESVEGLLLGIGVALAAVAVMAAVGVVVWTDDSGTVRGLLVEGAASLALLALPAAAEEALFRGYPLQALARAWGRGRALVVTSVGFGILHLGNPGLTGVAMLNLIVAGAFLGVVYLKSGSLWLATTAHLGWNWAHGFLADLPVSGLDLVDTPLWDGAARGAPWLGGGAFGPEGSILTTVVVALATWMLWRGSWIQPGAAARRSRPLTPLPGGTSGEDIERTKGR